MQRFTTFETAAPTARAGAIGGSARAEAIYRSIFDAVMDQRLPPGAKLVEEQLGAIFEASRTLVRSALQALAQDHIVTIERHRGAFVCAPTVADAEDIFFSRKVVEAALAREAARRTDAARIADLRGLLADEREALRRGERRKAIRLSGDFHIAVAAICGEGALTQFLRSLVSRSSLVIALYGRSAASACGHDEHAAFLDALEAGDGERAARLMTEHLDHIFRDLALAERSEAPVDIRLVLRA
ncbi:MAG TPA: GntR family transcriptional regulator [Roseiarcus sp.]|jgi:DNA-binding GntR family transcriptional regulator